MYSVRFRSLQSIVVDEQRLRSHPYATDALPDKCRSHQKILQEMMMLTNKIVERRRSMSKSKKEFCSMANKRIQ